MPSFTIDDNDAYSPVCSDDDDDDEEEDVANNTTNGFSTNTDNNANSESAELVTTNNTDNSEIMRLLDIACRNTETMEDNVLDKEDEEDISQGIYFKTYLFKKLN